jgi:tripeptide aminopeptidase
MVNKDRLIEIFIDLVKISSPTFKEKDVADYLLESMLQMGIEAFTDDSYLVTGCNTGNVIARLPGNTVAKPLILNAHMDTIEPTENIKIDNDGKIIKTDGNTILGADCKAGVAAIMEVLHALIEGEVIHGPLEIIITTAEEKGLIGAKYLDYSKIKSKDCIVLDIGGDAGTIVYAAPSQNNLKMLFKGKASHAGVDPENGISAIMAANRAISKMKTGRIDNETTSNIGVIEGGKATNIVAPECLVMAEARSLDDAKLSDLTRSMVEAAKEGAEEVGAKVEVEVESLYKGYSLDSNQAIIRVAELAAKETGMNCSLKSTIGGSDANIFNEKGINSISLSNCSYDVHSNDEFLEIEGLYKTVLLTLKIIEIFAGENSGCFI